MQGGFLEEAKRDLKRAQSLDKSNSYIKKLLKVCTAKHKAYVEKQQKLYANMFGGGKKKKKKKGKAVQKKQEDQKEETAGNGDGAAEESEKTDGGKGGDAMEVDEAPSVSV